MDWQRLQSRQVLYQYRILSISTDHYIITIFVNHNNFDSNCIFSVWASVVILDSLYKCKVVLLESEVGYRLTSQGHLLYLRENHGLANIRLPWYNGISFRTRQQSPTVLMTVELGGTAMNDQPSHIVIRVCFVVSLTDRKL